MPTVDIGEVHILFSPDVELLLIHDSLYRLDCSDRADILVPIPMPSLFKLQRKQSTFGVCRFSSSHEYVAVTSEFPFGRNQAPILHVYHISADDGQIAELDISIGHVEMLTGFKIAFILPDFHPSQPTLGLACWVKVAADEWHVKFLILNLQSMDLEHVLPSLHEPISSVGRSTIVVSQIHK